MFGGGGAAWWSTCLPHEDLGSLDEDGGAGDVEPLLQTLQAQLLHLLVAALHLHRVKGQHGDLVHVLTGPRRRERDTEGKKRKTCYASLDDHFSNCHQSPDVFLLPYLEGKLCTILFFFPKMV